MFCQELASPPAISDSKFDPIDLDHLTSRSGLGFEFLGIFYLEIGLLVFQVLGIERRG